MTIHFTSDLHFYHKNIIELSKRPFENLDEMHEKLIDNWNKVVRPDDQVYLLGDVAFCSKTKAKALLDRLHGKIYLIRGNHDHDILKGEGLARFEWVKDMYYLKVPDTDGPDGQMQPIILCHYPFQVWNHVHYGAWHLHGHCHGNLAVDMGKKRHDVGVDNNFYKPISYERVKDIMSTRVPKPDDHHYKAD